VATRRVSAGSNSTSGNRHNQRRTERAPAFRWSSRIIQVGMQARTAFEKYWQQNERLRTFVEKWIVPERGLFYVAARQLSFGNREFGTNAKKSWAHGSKSPKDSSCR
jgi:hypothetical protein